MRKRNNFGEEREVGGGGRVGGGGVGRGRWNVLNHTMFSEAAAEQAS